MTDFCRHERARPWLHIGFDVKSGRDTRFGDLMWCDECGMGFASPMPKPDEIAAHYELDSYYTQSASHLPDLKPGLADRIVMRLAWQFDREPEAVVQAIRRLVPEGRSFLDIGCGRGHLLSQAAEAGFEAVGVEPDPEARANAEAAGFKVYDGVAEALPHEVSARRFDAITSTHVLEHCIDPAAALKNAASMMTPGSILYIEVPNAEAIYFQTHAQISEMLDVPRHLQFFTRRALERLCASAGLAVIEWRYFGYTRHFLPGWCAWENGIHDRLVARGETPLVPRRSPAGSLGLIARSARAPDHRKYDAIGFFARLA